MEDIDFNSLLTLCSGETRRLLSPLLNYGITHDRLHSLYNTCKKQLQIEQAYQEELKEEEVEPKVNHENKNNDVNTWEVTNSFIRKLESFESREKFKELAKVLTYQTEHKIENMDPKMRIMTEDERPSWVASFQEQVDYIPGRTSGKRVISIMDMNEHLHLGERCKNDGNLAYQKDKNWELALTRYTQGVETLKQVTCPSTQEEANKKWLDLYIPLLSNQASAALQLKQHRLTLTAATECVEEIDHFIDEYKRQKLRQVELELLKEKQENENKDERGDKGKEAKEKQGEGEGQEQGMEGDLDHKCKANIEEQNKIGQKEKETVVQVIEMNDAQEFDLSEIKDDVFEDEIDEDEEEDNIERKENEDDTMKEEEEYRTERKRQRKVEYVNRLLLEDDTIVEFLRFRVKVLGQRATARRFLGDYELAIFDIMAIRDHHGEFKRYLKDKEKTSEQGEEDQEEKVNLSSSSPSSPLLSSSSASSSSFAHLSSTQIKYVNFVKASTNEGEKLFKEMKELEKKEKMMGKKMFSKTSLDHGGLYPDKPDHKKGSFSSSSSSTTTTTTTIPSPSSSSISTSTFKSTTSNTTKGKKQQQEKQQEQESKQTYRLSVEQVLTIQQKILALYEQADMVEKFNELRRLSEYDTVRFIRRLRSQLPTFLASILVEYNFTADTNGYQEMDRAISKHISKNDEIKKNAREILSLLMGDMEG